MSWVSNFDNYLLHAMIICCHYKVLFLLGSLIVIFNLHPTISWYRCQQLNKPQYWLLSYYCTKQTLIERNVKVEEIQHLNIGQSLNIQDKSTKSWTLAKESNICSNKIRLNQNFIQWNGIGNISPGIQVLNWIHRNRF